MPSFADNLLRKNEIKIPARISQVTAIPILPASIPFLLKTEGSVTKLIPMEVANKKVLKKIKFISFEKESC
jgi:hypothetical protein